MRRLYTTLIAAIFAASCTTPEQSPRTDRSSGLVEELNDIGVPVEIVEYQRPDERILEAWHGLTNLDCGKKYTIRTEQGRDSFTLEHEGEGRFSYTGRFYRETRTEKRRSISTTQAFGGISGDPYTEPLAAHALNADNNLRRVLLVTYENNKHKGCK